MSPGAEVMLRAAAGGPFPPVSIGGQRAALGEQLPRKPLRWLQERENAQGRAQGLCSQRVPLLGAGMGVLGVCTPRAGCDRRSTRLFAGLLPTQASVDS